jgi:hypothetical protein
MSREDEVKHRARYTLEFKLEAVRLVKAPRVPWSSHPRCPLGHSAGSGAATVSRCSAAKQASSSGSTPWASLRVASFCASASFSAVSLAWAISAL